MITQKVSKTSVKASLFKLRSLVAAIVLFLIAQMGWSETYYWVGGGADNDWGTLANWKTQPDGSGDTPVNLTTSDSVIIPSGAPVISNYSTNQVSSITIQSGAKLYITCSVDFSSTAFVNNGNVYFYNQTGGSEIEFKTPAGCNTLGKFNFWGETRITINGDCTADTFNMMADSDSHYVTDNFDATIAKGTGNGKLTVTNGMEFSRASGTDGKTGSIIFSADVGAGSIVTHSGVIFTLYNGYTINTATYEHNAGNGDVVARTIIFGVFNATTSFDMAVSTYANAGSTEVSVGPTGQLNSPLIKTTKRTYSNTSSTEPFSNEGTINTKVFDIPYEIINKGTITANADGTSASITAGSFTDNGAGTGTINLKNGTTSLTVTDDSTQNAIVLEETDSTIEGNYTLTSFTADDTTTMQGKNVTLNNSEITATTLSLKGASGDGNSLSLAGTGTTHKFISTGLSATYLSIDSNIQLANYSTAISDCVPAEGTSNADYGAVINNGWLIKAKNTFEYTWTGSSGTAWDNGANWDTLFVPGTDCKIIIPAATNKPVLPDTECYGGTLTIASGASIKLGTTNLVLSGNEGSSAGTILTNNGSIIYTGEGRITDNSASPSPINDNIHGTVEYAAGGTPGTVTDFYSDADTDDYNNLLISGTGWRLANTLKMQTITIANGATCSVNSATTLRAQTFTFNASGDNKNISATADLTLLPYVAANDLTVPSGIGSKFTISSAGKLYLGNALTNSIIFSASDTFEYELNFSAPVTLNQDITVHNSVTANANISGTGELIFAGTGDINFNAGTYVHSRITVNKDAGAGSLTINGNCTLSNLNITSGKTITFAGTPAITNYADTATGGNLIFTNGASFTNSFTRNSGGTTQITGTINAASVTLKAATIRGSAGINAGVSGTITLNGNVTGAASSSLNLSSPVIIGEGTYTISADTIVFANGATIDGSGTANLTLSPTTSVTINENIGGTSPLASFAITGPSSIKCASIKTTGNQSYSGQVTLAGSGNLTLSATGTTPQLSFTADIVGTGKTLQLPSTDATAVFGDGVTVNPSINSSGTVKAAGSVTFKDANTFTNFTATDLGGKTLAFAAGKTQTVSGDLSLSGTSTTSYLALVPDGSGSWTLDSSAPAPSISYVDVSYSTSVNEITATGSNDRGHNTNWNFPGMPYTWKTAAVDSDWTNPSNWEEGSVPGKGAVVTIPAATNYPVLAADLDLLYNTNQGTITVTGKFDLDRYKLTVYSITNNGQVLLKGTTDQIDGSVTNGDDSIVEYYDDTTTLGSSPWGSAYENLIIKKPVNLDGTSINVAKVTTIKNVSGKTVSLNNSSNHFTGGIVLDNAGEVTINANAAITIADDAQADSLTLRCAATVTDITTTGSQSYTGELTLDANAVLTASDSSSTISFDQNINGSGKTLTLSSGDGTSIAAGKTIYPSVVNNGVLTCSGAVTFKGEYSGTSATLNLADAVTTFEADVNLSGTTLNAGSGTVSIGGTGGAVTITGAKTFNDFTTSRSLVFTGDNEFQDFTASVPGGTITFPAGDTNLQTINGNLALSGAAGNLLTLTGSGIWKIDCTSSAAISYVDVINSTSVNEITATGSYDRGHNTNWNFPGMTYTWKTAATDSVWTNAANWTPSSVPGKGADVTIPAATNYPVLQNDLNILYNSTQGKITVNGTFDLAGKSLTLAEIQNNGTLRANGLTGQAITGTMKNGADSTIVYYGTDPTTNLFWDGNSSGKQYEKLILESDINVTGNINITAAETITIKNASIQSTGNQIYDGAVIINSATTALTSSAGNISFVKTISGDAGTETLTLSAGTLSFADSVTNLANLTVNADISIGTSGIQLAASQINFASDISAADKTLAINTPALNSTKASASTITANQITLSQDTTVTSSNGIILNVPEVSGSGISITNSNALTLGSEINVIPAIVNSGTITCAGAATFKESFTNSNGTITGDTTNGETLTFEKSYSGTGNMTASTGTTTFKANIDLSGTSFIHSNGKVLINPTGASSTVTGPANFHDFELKKSAAINGNNSYNDFTASGLSDQTITFEAGKKQTINGILTLTGADEHLLTLTGSSTSSWQIYCTNATYNHVIQYVKVYYSDNNDSSYFLTAWHSEDWGGNVKWNFPDQVYKWQGIELDHETDWNTATNWAPASVPGKGSNIKILKGKTYYPIITQNLDIWQSDTYPGSIEIEAGTDTMTEASFDLRDNNLKAGTITNNGILKLIGKTDQTIEAKMINGPDSTVEYTGTGDPTTVLPWDGDNGAGTDSKQYENLVFDRAINVSGDINVTASGTITIKNASIKSSGNQTYGGAVVINEDTVLSSTGTDKEVYFKSTVTGDGAHSLTVSAADSRFDGAVTNLTALTTDAAQIYCTQITTTITQTYNGDVTLYQSPELEATQITFGADITGAGKTLSIDSSKLISSIAASNEAEIALDKLALLQDVEISSSNAAGLKLTVGSITGSDKTLTFAGNTSMFTLKDGIIVEPTVVNNKSITCAGAATFNQTYSGTGARLNLAAATTTFKNNLDLSGTTLDASTGTIQFNGNGTAQALTTKADGSTHFYNITIATPAKVSTTSSFFVDGTTWTNTTNADGFVAETPSQITFNNADAAITIGGKNTFNKIVFPTDSQTVSVTGSNTITDLTSTGASQNITFNSSNVFDTVEITGAATNLTAENTQNEFNGIITIGTASVATGNISLKARTSLNFAANFNCNSATLNAGTNAVIFNGNAAYNTSFVNNGTATTTFLASFTGSGNATFVSDAILQGTAGSAYNLSCPDANLIKCKNFILYSGNYTFGGRLETAGDVIILGSDYVVDDSETGIANVFAYNQTRLSDPQFSGTFPAASSLSGTITANANASIKVGKNFYANGTSLQGNSDWYIQLPKICDASHGFAEAIKTSAKNCKVSCWETPSNTATDDNADAKIAAYSCTDNSGNANWDFADFTINGAYTVRDNAICITFSDPVRNLNNEINGTGGTIQYLKYQNATGTTSSFEGFYSDPDCQNDKKILGADLPKTVYIKAPSTWNTDATGKSSGEEGSTDRNGNHKTAIPYLDIPRSLTAAAAGKTNNVNYIITNKWGKRLNNYSTRTPTASHAYGDSGDSNDVLDKTGPVLYSVRTGQELHTAYDSAVGESSEHSYDSHNFIEFLYSEKVDFAGSSDDTALNNVDASTDTFVENIQVTDDLGAIKDSITVEGSLSFAGLGTIQYGLIHTGSSGSTDKYVNALYRTGANAEYSVRLSIAGYTDPLNTVTDPDGNTYKKWIGYIEEAVQPTGSVIHLVNASNENICVKDKEGNVQIKYENDSSNKIPIVNENGQISPVFTSCYGDWDISEPIFAIIRQNIRTLWAAETFDPDYQAEAIGNNSGVGSTLDRIEFHLYDNSPKFTSASPEWFTEVGWCNPGSSGLKSELYLANDSYAADIFGGARAFDSTERTSGGIRYSTIVNSAGAFKYGVAGALPSSLFDTTKPVYPGATSLIFTGASNPRRAASDLEGLYFALPLPDSVSFDVKTSFTVSYNENQAYITDLAGNRLRSKTVSTVDRTPPSIDMTISPIGADEIEIVFVKTLVTDSSLIHYITDHVSLQDEPITEQFEYLIGKCFDIITIDSSGAPAVVDSSDLKIDTSSPAKVWVTTNSNNSGFTHIKLKLNRAITLQDIQEKFIRVTFAPPYAEESVDLFTQKPGSRVTFIQDENGNTIQMYTAHALSDFAVGEVNPLYAYDSSMTLGDGSIISGGLWHTDTSDDVDPQSWAVHDWNRDQKNYGTLPAGHTLAIVADTVSAANVNIYLANKPDEKSISTQANKDFEFKTPWRIWLPDLMPGVFASLAEKNNTNFAHKSGELLSDKANRFVFDLDSSITDLWSSEDQVSFLFGITNSDGSPVTIMHSPELDINHDKQYLPTSTKMPLFALRQTDPDDFLSLDLWSFRLKSLVSQKGGVTILNNVIDSSVGEKVVLRVDLPEAANLTVLVMTLDGNIVDYLQRGMTSAGEHYYSWNGSNRNGKAVARGMYFIRVMSKSIDETRKVMVVKE